MSKLEELEQRIKSLPPEELSRFRAWFLEFDHQSWDRKIEFDAKAGKLDRLLNEALADYNSGKARDI